MNRSECAGKKHGLFTGMQSALNTTPGSLPICQSVMLSPRQTQISGHVKKENLQNIVQCFNLAATSLGVLENISKVDTTCAYINKP